MKKLFIFVLLFSGLVLANNAASNTSSTQRWPWNGKVDINYTLTATTTKTTPVFSVKFFGIDSEENTFELTTITGDGSTGITLGSGEKKTTWDAAADLGTEVAAAGYKIGVYAEDVTEQATYLVLDLTTYKMTTSTNGPSVAAGASSKYAELWLRRIENGTFVMGSAFREPGRIASREEEHTVTLTKAYYIGVFELTVGQYERINNGSTSSSSVLPEINITYDDFRGASSYGSSWPTKDDHRVDADSFFGQLRIKTGNGLIFDLPTEAQWEAASRWKGTTGNGTNDYYGSFSWNNGSKFSDTNFFGLGDLAWFRKNSDSKLHEVGLKAASTIGTYDMHGNGREWCLDWYAANISSYVLDPKGPFSGTSRCLRDGDYFFPADECRLAFRGASYPNTHAGCRVTLVP